MGVGITIGVLLLAVFVAKRFNLGGQIVQGLGGFGQAAGLAITAPFQGLLQGVTAGAGGLGETAASLSEGFQRSVSSTLGFGPLLFSETQGFGGTGQVGGTVQQGTFTVLGTNGQQIIPTASGFSLAELLNKIERNPQEFVGGVALQDVESGNVFKTLTELLQQSGVTADPLFTGIQPQGNILDLKSILADASSRITASIARTTAPETSTSPPFGGFASATEQEAGLQATLARNALLFPQFFQ